jgi:hypothetical protein
VIQNLINQIDLRGRQTCHFIAIEKTETGSLMSFEMTPDLSIKFPMASLIISTSEVGSHIYSARAFKLQPLVEIRVTNPSSEPAFVRVPQTISQAHIRLIAQMLGPYFSDGRAQTSTLVQGNFDIIREVTFSTANGTALGSAGGMTTYQIDPSQTLTVHVQFGNANLDDHCLGPYGSPFQYAGFIYGLERAFNIQELSSRDDTEATDIFEIPAVTNSVQLPASVTFDQSLHEFGPHLPGVAFPYPSANVHDACF